LSDFLEYLKASQCADCGGRFLKHESDATHIFQEWYEYKAALSSLLRCETCGVFSCITCSATPFSKRSLVIFDNRSVSWCCTDGRLLVIWILLCGFDVPYCEMKVKNAEIKAELQSQPTEQDEGSERSKGKGKAESSRPGRSGVGYGGSSKNKTQSDPTSEKKAQMLEVQQAIDRLATTVLSLLENLLPSLDRGHAFDMGPPAMITDMLLKSRVLDYFVDLLLHDSLDEVSSRSATYSAVLDFVKVLSRHEITANSTVFSRRQQRPELCNLLTRTYRRTEVPTQEVVPSIADCLRERMILGDLQLKNAEQYKAFYDTESDQEILSHCRKISETWKSLGLHVRESTAEAEGSNTAEPFVNISDVDDDQICASHAFAGEAREQNRSAPGRFKRLVSEINILKSSLPRTIFVRHGESRLDVMKCVIIGAEDTPYENGIFEFDMYCPAEYPKNPPQVSFKGTDGGKHGINPNLYPDGKVCLSLLGTWPGQPWDPVQSTLLQVLVSIQAMVLCEQPWYNEPGREHAFGYEEAEVASEAYNRRIRELTVEIAMINWLEKIPAIWEDVVKRHFRSNADKILRTVTEWS
ncbi:hypothetical protein C7974DRAFT_271050, partial [Boeremia exigua]|uniref:uncharacterized protein n=1 Tax=Boeremia exigua TaxID=749465 RepID=UPI001E8DDC53